MSQWYLLSNPLAEPADRHVVSDLAKVLRAAGRVGQAGVDAVVVDARLLQLAVVVGLALALQKNKTETSFRLIRLDWLLEIYFFNLML